MTKRTPLIPRLAAFALGLLVASGVMAEFLVLKDGTQIETRGVYRRDGERVVFMLKSGVETFITADEVDFEKTDQVNEDVGNSARTISSSEQVIIDDTPQEEEKPTFGDLARRTSLSLPESSEAVTTKNIPRTPAGFADLWSFGREVSSDLEVTGEIGRYLDSQGVDEYQIFEGTEEGRVLLEMLADSESAVFKSLKEAAAALKQAQSLYPERLKVLELVMSTAQGRRAGQFILTTALANEYLSGRIDPPTFFHRHVQF